MKLREKLLSYPVVVTEEDNVYYVSLLDFSGDEDGKIDFYRSYSECREDIFKVARELLSLELAELFDNRKEIIRSLKRVNIELEDNQYILWLKVNPRYEVSKVKRVI